MQFDNSPGIVSSLISGKRLPNALMHLGGDGRLHGRWQRRKAGSRSKLLRVLGEVDAQRGQVVVLAGHRVTEDDGRVFEIERALRVTVVEERRAAARYRPLLSVVHGIADARRDRQSPLQRTPLPLPHPPADLRIRLVGRLRIGIVVECRIPAVRRHISDAVATVFHVLPERCRTRRVGQNGAHRDNRNGPMCCLFHGLSSAALTRLAAMRPPRARRGRRQRHPCRRQGRLGRDR